MFVTVAALPMQGRTSHTCRFTTRACSKMQNLMTQCAAGGRHTAEPQHCGGSWRRMLRCRSLRRHGPD